MVSSSTSKQPIRTTLLSCHVVCLMALLPSLPTLAADLQGPYLGQTPPGTTPQIFAPGIVTMANRSGGRIAFSPDGTECFFTTMNADWTNWRVYYTKVTNGVWTTPALASFSVSQQAGQPCFSQDGNKLYFTSSPNPQGRFYVIERTPAGWSAPVALQSPIYSGSGEWSYSQTVDGTAYFASQRPGGAGGMDLYRTRQEPGQPLQTVNLGTLLNSQYNERVTAVAPDGSYLIFSSARAGRYEQNLYVSFANGNGGWNAPIDLNVYCQGINTPSADEHEPSLSPDEEYLFFDREGGQGGVYWVANPVPRPDPNGPISNLSAGQRFACLQTAIDYAQSGQIIQVPPGTYVENILIVGKDLVLQSIDPNDPNTTAVTVLNGNGTDPVVCVQDRSSRCVVAGFTVRGGGTGLWCSGGSPRIQGCHVVANTGPGIELISGATPIVERSIIAANGGLGVKMPSTRQSRGATVLPALVNCTIVQNAAGGISGGAVTVRNCILYFNGPQEAGPQIETQGPRVTYSCVQSGFTGEGNIATDPWLVSLGRWTEPNDVNHPARTWINGDYHLQSRAGCWDPNRSTWVRDSLTSPCVDAGSPADAVTAEPSPNGGRIDMGAYGGTTQASKSPFAQFTETGQQLNRQVGRAVSLGDFNSDGALDAFVVNENDYRVYLGDGQGLFTDSGQRLTKSFAAGLAVIDLNGDGRLEVVTGRTVWASDSQGRFTSQPLPIESSETGDLGTIQFADLNGDGYPDLFALRDVDGDGDNDAVTAGWRWNGSTQCPNHLWLNDGQGTFHDSGRLLDEGGSHVHGLALADLSGDDRPELAMGIQDTNRSGRIYLNDGTGRLVGGPNLGSSGGENVAIGDFDGDGAPDVFVAHSTPPSRVWLNNGDGSLRDSSARLGANCTWDVAAGDLNADGKLDAFTVGSVWTNSGLAPAPAQIWLNTTPALSAPTK